MTSNEFVQIYWKVYRDDLKSQITQRHHYSIQLGLRKTSLWQYLCQLYSVLQMYQGLFSPNNSQDTDSSPVRVKYGCLPWDLSLTEVLPWNFVYCMWYHVVSRAGVKYVLSNTNTNTNTKIWIFQIKYKYKYFLQLWFKYKYKYKYIDLNTNTNTNTFNQIHLPKLFRIQNSAIL